MNGLLTVDMFFLLLASGVKTPVTGSKFSISSQVNFAMWVTEFIA